MHRACCAKLMALILVAAASVAVRGDTKPDKQLEGLFMFTRSDMMLFQGRFIPQLRREYFYFFPDGHMVFGCPTGGQVKEHPGAADFAAFQKADPDNCGTYKIEGGKITLQREKGKPETFDFALGNPPDGSAYSFGPAVVAKMFPFAKGDKLSGAYENDMSIQDGRTDTFIVKTLKFNANGTVASDNWVGFDSRSVHGAKRETVGQVKNNSAGTYTLDGYTLTMVVDGQTRTATACRWKPEGNAGRSPETFFIDGQVYQVKK